MTRLQAWLVGLLAVELGVGSYFVVRHVAEPSPPMPDLIHVDPVAADEIRALAAACRTPAQWAELGEVFLATGYFPEAEACLRVASGRSPTNADLAFQHALALERLGRLDEANAANETAVARGLARPGDAWYFVGRNHLRLGAVEAATAAYRKAGSQAGARYELALLDAEAGRRDEAEAAARRLADEYTDAYPPVGLSYRLALTRGDRPTADRLADEFTRRPRVLPTPFDAVVNRVFGLAQRVGQDGLFVAAGRDLRAGRLDAAEAKLRAALDAGWYPDLADSLAEVLAAKQRHEEAARLLDEAVVRGRPSFELLWRSGQGQAALGRMDAAVAAWERAAVISTGPAATELYRDLASHYDRAGVPDKGKAFATRADLAAATDALAAKKPAEAVAAAGRATARTPDVAAAWFLLGEAQRTQGRAAEARAAYERCLALDPDHGRAHRGLALLPKLGEPGA